MIPFFSVRAISSDPISPHRVITAAKWKVIIFDSNSYMQWHGQKNPLVIEQASVPAFIIDCSAVSYVVRVAGVQPFFNFTEYFCEGTNFYCALQIPISSNFLKVNAYFGEVSIFYFLINLKDERLSWRKEYMIVSLHCSKENQPSILVQIHNDAFTVIVLLFYCKEKSRRTTYQFFYPTCVWIGLVRQGFDLSPSS